MSKHLFLRLVTVAISLLIKGGIDAAFVTKQNASPFVAKRSATFATPTTSTLQLRLHFEQFSDVLSSILPSATATSTVNSMWLATVDSDIAKLSDNEFAPVFFGGIMVMVGGVVSAMIVGFILEKRDLYANVVADSYAQGNAEDEAFWKGLSDEEKKKTQEAIERLRKSKGGQQPATLSNQNDNNVAPTLTTAASEVEPSAAATATSTRAVVEAGASTPTSQNGTIAPKLDMFSDYADS